MHIHFHRHVLSNGLRLLIHADATTQMVAFNVLYDVGSKDENHERTGLAHLLEHLMFEGSRHIPDFDTPLQQAGGENNAFTNSDYTNYYEVLPANNLETAFWLESDRMTQLHLNEEGLEVQKKVILEEFNEECLQKPYGDVWHHLKALAYQQHPYRFPVIGKEPAHISLMQLPEVEEFYRRYYQPANAIIVVAGNVQPDDVLQLAEKWFGDIPSVPRPPRTYLPEPPQQEYRLKILPAPTPVEVIFMAFKTPPHQHPDFLVCDLLADMLCAGKSSHLQQQLVEQQAIFSSLDIYLSDEVEEGLWIIEGKVLPHHTAAAAEQAVWRALEQWKQQGMNAAALEKALNRTEAQIHFTDVSILSRATNLAFYELCGDAAAINEEVARYRNISSDDLLRVAAALLQPTQCSVLRYEHTPAANRPKRKKISKI